jgi:hypothetical protein
VEHNDITKIVQVPRLFPNRSGASTRVVVAVDDVGGLVIFSVPPTPPPLAEIIE